MTYLWCKNERKCPASKQSNSNYGAASRGAADFVN